MELKQKLAADLERFAAWREQRQRREPIPEALWRLAMEHVSELGLNRVCREFRLNYTQLKQKVDELGRGATARRPVPPAAVKSGRVARRALESGFVELAWPAAGGCSEAGRRRGLPSAQPPRLRLVLERVDGGRLSIEGGRPDLAFLEGVLRCFYEGS